MQEESRTKNPFDENENKSKLSKKPFYDLVEPWKNTLRLQDGPEKLKMRNERKTWIVNAGQSCKRKKVIAGKSNGEGGDWGGSINECGQVN